MLVFKVVKQLSRTLCLAFTLWRLNKCVVGPLLSPPLSIGVRIPSAILFALQKCLSFHSLSLVKPELLTHTHTHTKKHATSTKCKPQNCLLIHYINCRCYDYSNITNEHGSKVELISTRNIDPLTLSVSPHYHSSPIFAFFVFRRAVQAKHGKEILHP